MRRPFVVWTTLKCEFGNGSWAVIDGIVHVRTAEGTKAAQLTGNNTGEILARLLMWEISTDQQRDVA